MARLAALTLVAGTVLAAVLVPPIGAAGALAAAATAGSRTSAPSLAGDLPAVTTVTDSTGAPLAYLYDQYRTPVTATQIAPAMLGAVVAIEDRRFFAHGGVDPVGTLRALVNNAAGGPRQGASTLTEQYVKNYDLYVAAHTDAERRAAVAPTVARKITDAGLAIRLDQTLSKDDILTRYLDVVYFGHGAYGVGAAARAYFATTPDRLTVAQAALLAGMVQSPAGDDPVRHPAAALARRDVVIDQMHQQGMITESQAATAAGSALGIVAEPTVPQEGCTAAGSSGYFCAYLLAYLDRAGLSLDRLRSGGYTIVTTLDPVAQNALQQAVNVQVPPATPQVADVMSVVTPGADAHPVVAMAANRPYGNGPGQSAFGLPFQPENLGAGSVYKIFTAASALEQGIAGIDTVLDVPPSGYLSPIYRGANGRPVPVANAGTYPVRLTLTDALARSPNTTFVKLEERTGVAPVVDMAIRLGLTSLATAPADGSPSVADLARTQNQASFTLGVSPTSGVELANVMATLAGHGTWCPPSPVTSITDRNGSPVTVTGPPCRQAVEPGLADTLMVGLGRDTAAGGTSAAAASSAGWTRPVAGKTGTTQRHQSAAFAGATPQLGGAAIVFDDSAAPRPLCDGSPPHPCGTGTLFGGAAPARTFYAAMGAILRDRPPAPLPVPDPRYLGSGAR
ncbi:MAG: penicillin-binding protein [Pseudonocardia sp.]|nr:penicillin-binding protein [Pseudonocardia sp.]